MTRKALTLCAAVVLLAGCESERRSAAGFRLPEAASVEHGKNAFVALGCHQCHEVNGIELPKHSNPAVTTVKLGGEVSNPVTDGYLVASIIYPTYSRHRQPSDAHARSMPDLAEKMTVQQMIDMVEFLQSAYTVRKTRPGLSYY